MELCLLNLLILIDFCIILTLVCSCDSHVIPGGITCLFVKFGENLPRSSFEILKFPSFHFLKFQKSELGKFIPNFPLKHVITNINHTVDSNQHCTVNGVIL